MTAADMIDYAQNVLTVAGLTSDTEVLEQLAYLAQSLTNDAKKLDPYVDTQQTQDAIDQLFDDVQEAI